MSDLNDWADVTRVFVRLTVAAILGGVLGYERGRTGKAAGLRTHMLVALGAALYVLVPQLAGASPSDMTRVLQGLVAGIGFLGAGAIIHTKGGEPKGGDQKSGDQKNDGDPKEKSSGEVVGLTTAAGIWLTAAIGMAAGMGREATAIFSTILALIILTALGRFDAWLRPK